MATPRAITTKAGRTWWYVAWSDAAGKTHQKALHTRDRVVALSRFADFCRKHGLKSGIAGPRGGFQDARRAFLDAVGLGAKAVTVAMVSRKLDAVADGLGEPWDDWTADAFRRWLDGKGWEPRTIQMHVHVARRFSKWARAEGFPCPDFAAGVKGPRVRVKRPRVHTPEQMRALLAEAEGHPLERAIHLACRGLSKGDLRTLDWGEVDLRGRRVLRDRQKSGEELPIPLEGRLLALLKSVPAAERVGRVNPAIAAELHAGNEDRALRIICRRAGVPECGWHLLRHSFATMLYAEGVGLPTIGRLLGHAQGSPMTLRYVTPDWKALTAAARKAEKRLAP